MNDLRSVLDAFKAANGLDASVWKLNASGSVVPQVATTDGLQLPAQLPTLTDGPASLATPKGEARIAAIPGPRRSWLVVGPGPADRLDAQLQFLLPVVSLIQQSALEVEHAANELAERYEEINLLYTISEILGRTVALEEVSGRILQEVSETVGARRAVVFVHDARANTLVAAASLGVPPGDVRDVAVTDENSLTARVFRTCHAAIVDSSEVTGGTEAPFADGAMLAVPIMWTSPRGGAEPLGVVLLADRRSRQPFSAGDQKLISAIATQIGTAIQNARLVRESLSQQRLRQEMQLAHDLQMRLLPAEDTVAPVATVAARVVPAESVGGDLYHLFRLGSDKTGVMIGDVSGHGYQAALIMALTMSAAAIHAQTTADPGETLTALLASLSDELATTEMFMSAFYGVVDRRAGVLRYGNAGHPHAFVISATGAVDRLPALDPPLGMGASAPRGASRDWHGDDLLLLFTDGVSDARNRDGDRLGEERVLEAVVRHRTEHPRQVVDGIFALLDRHAGDTRRRDDLTVVALRS